VKVGETLQTAIWLTGTETPELRERYEKDVTESLLSVSSGSGFVVGPIYCTELKPGEDRVPPVPDHIQGPDVRLLVVEAVLVAELLEIDNRGFIGELTDEDLAALRRITRARSKYPLSDTDCDDIINELGPDSAVAALKQKDMRH
jgi:hypothetical protein